MSKNKLIRFAETAAFPHFFQPTYEELCDGFALRGKWNSEFFKDDNPLVLEIGCGRGEYTVGLAESYPERNFIGIDIKGARMWVGAREANEKKLANVAFLRTKAELLELCFSKGEVNEIWITFPDPQPTKRRAKNRLTHKRFLLTYARILNEVHLIHLKTDSDLIYEFTLDVIREEGHQVLLSSGDLYNYTPRLSVHEIQTYYEGIYLEQGIPIKYIQFRLRADYGKAGS